MKTTSTRQKVIWIIQDVIGAASIFVGGYVFLIIAWSFSS